MLAVLAGANLITHAGGWLEGGLVRGLGKAVMDADLCGKLVAFAQGSDLSEKLLGSTHAHARFETAFFQPQNADAKPQEQSLAEGAEDAASRANAGWKRRLEAYERPPSGQAIDDELTQFVARRKAEIMAAERA